MSTQYGDVNTGSATGGFLYNNNQTPPYYTVSSHLGGISTAHGGNVTIDAGGNVTSYSVTVVAASDAGSGAFGSNPGNVTINAGADVYGHYVLANGVGSITAGQDIGESAANQNVALSLIKGGWTLNAPNGNIYLQEVRNPNGIFNNTTGTRSHPIAPGNHFFDYDSQAYIDLNAGVGVLLTDASVPRLNNSDIPVIYPPTLDITAGSGGVVLSGNVILFPSAFGNLNITTTDGGNFSYDPNGAILYPELEMSDSSKTRFDSASAFGDTDHGTGSPIELNNLNPVTINISGNMQNINLITTKRTIIKVGGDMINSSFSGENLHPTDVTSIDVTGQIYNRSPYSFVNLTQPILNLPASDLPQGSASTWESYFTYAVNPDNIPTPAGVQAAGILPSQLTGYILQLAAYFPSNPGNTGNPGFVYNATTGRLGFRGQMSQNILENLLAGPGQTLTVLRFGANGLPIVDTTPGDNTPGRTYGQYEYDLVTWAPASAIQTLYTESQGAPSPSNPLLGYQIGGPGTFDVTAGSIALGNSYGILSWGIGSRYANLTSITTEGATVNVTSDGDIDMLTSTIATLGGGDVNVTSLGGSMDLGSQELLNNATHSPAFGVYTAGQGNVNVTALDNIDVAGSRIATFDGGNITVESLHGDVNAGTGGSSYVTIPVSYLNASGTIGYIELVFGSGILANTLIDPSQVPGHGADLPGNITIETPRGSIYASQGGILQEALNGSIAGGPTITLEAGTPAGGDWNSKAPPDYVGNVDLGDSGVIGGTVNVRAAGNILGLVISRQSSNIQAAQNFAGTVLAGGSADVSGGGTVSGTIIGAVSANVSGGGGVTAEVLSQNANVGGVGGNTLGTSAPASNTAQSAALGAGTESKKLASNTDDSDDDKKHQLKPSLSRHIKRVTVILPKAG